MRTEREKKIGEVPQIINPPEEEDIMEDEEHTPEDTEEYYDEFANKINTTEKYEEHNEATHDIQDMMEITPEEQIEYEQEMFNQSENINANEVGETIESTQENNESPLRRSMRAQKPRMLLDPTMRGQSHDKKTNKPVKYEQSADLNTCLQQ